MNLPAKGNSLSCKEIVELLNELLDGDASPERQEEARQLIKLNPQCKALYATLEKSMQLYKQRLSEADIKPSIDWKKAGLQK
jgi:hypothetical protein